MNPRDFIEQSVARQIDTIVLNNERNGLPFDLSVKAGIDYSKRVWCEMQRQLDQDPDLNPGNQEPPSAEPDDRNYSVSELEKDRIYTAEFPAGHDLRKIIFALTSYSEAFITCRFALYSEKNGDYTIHLHDDDATNCRSFYSEHAAVVAKNITGIEMLRLMSATKIHPASDSDIDLLREILGESKIEISIADGCFRKMIDDTQIHWRMMTSCNQG